MLKMVIFGATRFPDVFSATMYAQCIIAPAILPMELEVALAILMAVLATTLEEIDY